MVLLICFSVLLFLVFASTFSALGAALPSMVRDQGWSWTTAGFGFTLLGAACGTSSFLPAKLIRRFGVRATLLAGTAVMVSGLMCLNQTHGLAPYFVGAALCGVGYQMMALIPGTHVLSAAFARRSLVFGIYFTFGSLGGVAGPWIVLMVMRSFHGDWRMVWLIQALAVLLAGLLCTLVVGDTKQLLSAADHVALKADIDVEPTAGRTWSVAAARRTPQFWVLFAAYFSQLLISSSVASMSIAHLTQHGVAMSVAGAMLSLESLVQVGARLLGGVVGEFIDRKLLLVVGLGAASLGIWSLGLAHNYPSILLYAVCSGLGVGLTALATTVLLLDYFGRRHYLELFSTMCLVGAGSAFNSVIGGLIRDRFGSFVPAFDIFGALVGVVFVAALFMRPPTPPGGRPVRSDADAVTYRTSLPAHEVS
jgi:MFS family permease